MSLQKVVIIGTGGFGREVLDVLEAVNQVSPTYKFLGFVTEPGYQQPGQQLTTGATVVVQLGFPCRQARAVSEIMQAAGNISGAEIVAGHFQSQRGQIQRHRHDSGHFF